MRADAEASRSPSENALFYKTMNGAQGGRSGHELIHLPVVRANSFEYLTELQRHACELAAG